MVRSLKLKKAKSGCLGYAFVSSYILRGIEVSLCDAGRVAMGRGNVRAQEVVDVLNVLLLLPEAASCRI